MFNNRLNSLVLLNINCEIILSTDELNAFSKDFRRMRKVLFINNYDTNTSILQVHE